MDCNCQADCMGQVWTHLQGLWFHRLDYLQHWTQHRVDLRLDKGTFLFNFCYRFSWQPTRRRQRTFSTLSLQSVPQKPLNYETNLIDILAQIQSISQMCFCGGPNKSTSIRAYRVWHWTRDWRGQPWGFPGQPAPLPRKTRTPDQGYGFLG